MRSRPAWYYDIVICTEYEQASSGEGATAGQRRPARSRVPASVPASSSGPQPSPRLLFCWRIAHGHTPRRRPAHLPVGPAGHGRARAAAEAADPAPCSTCRKAARYSVANFGASVIYAPVQLRHAALPDTYNLNPSLIGLLANERSFVGAFVQPRGRAPQRPHAHAARPAPPVLPGRHPADVPWPCSCWRSTRRSGPCSPSWPWPLLPLGRLGPVHGDDGRPLPAGAARPGRRAARASASGVGTMIFLVIALNLWEHAEFVSSCSASRCWWRPGPTPSSR